MLRPGIVLWVIWLWFDVVGSQVADGPPIITSIHEPQIVRQGFSFTLDCRATGAFPIEYRWIRDDVPITTFGSSGTFSVVNARISDGGEYRCIAKNAIGATVSLRSNVTIAYINAFPTDVQSQIESSHGGFILLSPPFLDAAPLSSVRWKWFFYDTAVYNNLTHFISENGNLVVLDVHNGYGGEYHVEATHDLFPGRVERSPLFRVSVQGSYQFPDGDPKIVLQPSRLIYQRDKLKGQNEFQLECVGHSRELPSLQIVWRQNGSIISSDHFHYEIREFGRVLIVKSPNYRKDGGQYTCEARRENFGSAPRETWVEIHEGPVITLPLRPNTISELGIRAELPCQAEGFPGPSFRWYFNGEDLAAEPMVSIGRDGSLLIHAVRRENTGVYQCEPYNTAGTALSRTWLRTEAKGPQFSIVPQNISVASGSRAEMQCQALGAPPPLIQWKHNNAFVVPDGLNYRIEGSNLMIPAANPQHAGSYTCVASNSEGVSDASGYLDIAGRAQIVRGPTDQSAIIGSNVMFPCQVSEEAGRGRFTRNWYFNGQLVTAGSSRTMDLRPDGSLFITQVGPSKIGTYSCNVTSPYGTQSESATLRIVEKPGMPLHVTAVLLNDSLPAKIRVAWTEGFDGNSAIIKYLLEHRILGGRELWSDWEISIENIGREQRSALVDNLKPSSVYEFRVIAVNRFGPGIPSQPSNNVTLPQQPPAAAPRGVAGSARSSSSIMVQWQPPPPEQWNGDILGYYVRYRLANYPDIPWISKNVSNSRARNILLEDLITWREYEIQVSAFNQRGMGVFSKSQHITTLEGLPAEAPKNLNATVLNSTAIYVSFTPPPQQMIPGVNLGFKIEAWKGPVITGMLAKEVRVLPYSAVSVEKVVNGLEKYVEYNVTTLCYTAPGDGPRSPPILLRTKEDTPGPVVNMRFDEVLFSSVKVLWEKPANPNGILLNYTLSYWVTNRSSTTRQVFKIPPEITEFKVSDLSASTHYSFDLYAETVIGRGPSQMATMESGVPPELPGPPSGLVISNLKADSVTLQFLPGYDGKTIITKWIVEGQIGSSTSWVLVYNISDPRATSIRINGLRPFAIYRLRLIAENVVGRSPPSQPSESFQTFQSPPKGPLSEFSAEPYSSQSIALSWTPLQSFAWNGVPKGYVIMYRQNNTATDALRGIPASIFGSNPMSFSEPSFTEIELLNPTSGEYVLTSLTPYTVYDLKILPFNAFGPGIETKVIHAETYEGRPSEAPSNVNAVAESSTKIRVTWGQVPREYHNGRILGFKIRQKRESGGLVEEKEVEVRGAERRDFLVEKLESFAQYQIQVAAFTIMGLGPANSNPVIVQTLEDTPGPPSEVKFQFVTFDQVRLTWSPPYKPNGIIKQYQVAHWRNSSTPQSAVRTELPRDSPLFVANGLQSQTVYAFSVSAETSVGWGEEAKIYVYTTNSKSPPSTPTEPILDSNQAQKPNAIGIRWDVQSSFTAPVRLVEIEFQEANSGDWVRWPEKIPGLQKRATISDLAPHTPYRFRLRSENDFSQSSWTRESQWFKTLDDDPSSPPLDVTANPYDSSAIRIAWTPPPVSTWNSDSLGYRILYKPYREREQAMQQKELPLSGPENAPVEYVIQGLPRFQHYVVQVQTFNPRGSSPLSPPVFVYVGYSVPKSSITNLRVENKSSTQLVAFWDPWPDSNEPVSGFKIRYAPQGDSEWKEEIVKSGESRVVLHELKKFSEYAIKVVPFNKAGEGPEAETTAQTPEDLPGPVGSLVFSDIMLDSVNVSWTPPTEPNGEIIGYLVHYETYRDEIEYVQKIQEKVKQTFMRATMLETNVTYTFWVKAETKMGYGARVAGSVRIGPQPGSPSSPLEITVTPRDTSVSLFWVDGAPGASPITSHIIQVQRIDSKLKAAAVDSATTVTSQRIKRQTKGPSHARGEWVTLATIESSRTSHSVSYDDLEKSSVYIFRVFARNSHGVSPPSPASDQVEVPEEREKPFYLQWWFLVILGLIALVIIVVVVALLCVTGKSKYKYEKRNSNDSLQLADGGIVTYELRASQRARNALQKNSTFDNFSGRPPPPRPDPGKWDDDEENPYDGFGSLDEGTLKPEPPPYGSVIRGGHGPGSIISAGSQHRVAPVSSFYDSLAAGTVVPSHHGFPPSNNLRSAGHQSAGYSDKHNQRSLDNETSTTGEDEESESDRDEKDVSSIVQHYQTSDVAYRETWRRAKKREAHRPESLSSQSEVVSIQNGHSSSAAAYGYHGHPTIPSNRNNPKSGVPGFSSFV